MHFKSMSQKNNSTNFDATNKMMLLWSFLFIVLYLALVWRVDFLQTSFDRTVAGLRTNTLYFMRDVGTVCRDDIVKFRSKERKARYIRKVAGSKGDDFRLLNHGYQINGIRFEQDEDWLSAAGKKLADVESLIVPDKHVLIVNSEFGTGEKNSWPFDILPEEAVSRRITRIVFSRDLSLIGQSIVPENRCHQAAAES